MVDVLQFLVVTGLCICFLAPRVFRVADTIAVRQRMLPRHRNVPSRKNDTLRGSPDEFFDSVARSIRRQLSTREALLAHVQLLPNEPPWNRLAAQLHDDISIDEMLRTLRQSHDETAVMLAMCATHGGLVADALDHAAHTVRAKRHAEQTLHVATAHTRLTMRILTLLPLALLALAIVLSSSVRSTLAAPATVLVLCLGIVLNRAGAMWVSRIVHRASSAHTVSETVALVDAFCVAVQAGHSIVEACLMWKSINSTGAHVSQLLEHGASLGESLRALAESPHTFDAAVAHTLIAAHADGLPVHSTAAMLAAENRATQQAFFQASAQQLPAKLSLPTVLCVLPSFCLLIVAPLLLAHLARFGSFLPSALT